MFEVGWREFCSFWSHSPRVGECSSISGIDTSLRSSMIDHITFTSSGGGNIVPLNSQVLCYSQFSMARLTMLDAYVQD